MKRILALTLALGLVAPIGLVGCGEEAGTKVETTTQDAGGTTQTTTETKVETTGENPPAPGAPSTPAPATP